MKLGARCSWLRGVRAAMYLRSQNCFLMIPRCQPGKNHPSSSGVRGGGGWGQNGRSHCITKGHHTTLGGWHPVRSLNPPQEKRPVLENSTNPVYQVSSQHSGRHPDLRVNERRARFGVGGNKVRVNCGINQKKTFPMNADM